MLKEEMEKLGYNNEMINACYLAVINHKRSSNPETIEGKIVRDADKIAYIGKNRWERCIKENPECLNEIIDIYLPVLRNDLLRLECSKRLFDRDMKSYIQDYMEILKNKKYRK